jgi:hypothetical protein
MSRWRVLGKELNMAKAVSGGGLNSRVVKRVGVKTGAPSSNKISPRGVSQYGYASGSMLRGEHNYTTQNSALPVNVGTMKQVPLGNQLVKNVGAGGPGTGRTTLVRGTQMMHGAPVQGSAPAPRDILSEFGPESNPSSLVRKR